MVKAPRIMVKAPRIMRKAPNKMPFDHLRQLWLSIQGQYNFRFMVLLERFYDSMNTEHIWPCIWIVCVTILQHFLAVHKQNPRRDSKIISLSGIWQD